MKEIEKVKFFGDFAYELLTTRSTSRIANKFADNLPYSRLTIVIEEQENGRYAVYQESLSNYY